MFSFTSSIRVRRVNVSGPEQKAGGKGSGQRRGYYGDIIRQHKGPEVSLLPSGL